MANKEMNIDKYLLIEETVNRYKNGEEGAADLLVELFQPILKKYIGVISYGRLDINSKTVRTFVKMFAKKGVNISQYKRSPYALKVAEEAIGLIHSMFYMYEPNEIENILVIVLLGLAQKYKTLDGRAQFHSYVTSCFHYRLYEHLMVLVDDPVNLCNLNDTKFHDNYSESASYDEYDLEMPSKNVAKLIGNLPENDEVGDDWLLGVNCEIFSIFTPLERKIFKLKFVDGLSDDEISSELSVCRHTIMRKRQKLVNQLASHATSKGLLRG